MTDNATDRQAREMLAAEFDKLGNHNTATAIRNGSDKGGVNVPTAIRAISTALAKIERLRALLGECGKRFRKYEASHCAKAEAAFGRANKTISGDLYSEFMKEGRAYDVKAARNREMAERCEAELSTKIAEARDVG